MKPRWCAVCAKGHAGAVNVTKKKCEGCREKLASHGLLAEREIFRKKRRWCAGCAPEGATAPPEAVKGRPKAVNPPRHFGRSAVRGPDIAWRWESLHK